MRSFYLIIAISALITFQACSSPYRVSKPSSDQNNFLNARKDAPVSPKTEFDEKNRYHSAYTTENPYYDGRNKILDGDIQGAVDILTDDIHSLDYPSRAALWVFISKCKLEKKEEAVSFLNNFVIPIKLDPDNQGVISTMLMYYMGDISEKEVLSRMKAWDDLDNCASYYYYGAYKNYYEGDFVTGNDYIARSLRTGINEYSEYKFAETEIRGFTSRNPSQYKDFPISPALAENAGFDVEISEEYIPLEMDDVQLAQVEEYLDGFPGQLRNPPKDVLLKEVGPDEYLVPSIDNIDSWEIVTHEELLFLLREEAVSMVDYMMGEKGYFEHQLEPEIHLIPTSNAFQTYSTTVKEFLSNPDEYVEEYGIDYSKVTLFLKEGDFIAGLKVNCDSYDSFYDSYGQEVTITINMLFSVREDRSVELVNHFFELVQEEEEEEEYEYDY